MAEKKEEEKKSLPQMVPKHHFDCNKEWYARKEVDKSQEEFPWKVLYHSLAMIVNDDFGQDW